MESIVDIVIISNYHSCKEQYTYNPLLLYKIRFRSLNSLLIECIIGDT